MPFCPMNVDYGVKNRTTKLSDANCLLLPTELSHPTPLVQGFGEEVFHE